MNNPTKVDTLQSLVTSWVHGISKGRLVSTLQKLGLACVTRVLTRGQDEEIVDESFKIKFCRWGIVILQFDNLGFKRGGAKAGYTQYTTLLWTEVPYFILEKCGVYEASRTRGAPPSDAKEYLPSRGDYEAVNERMVYSFELAMEASPHLLDVPQDAAAYHCSGGLGRVERARGKRLLCHAAPEAGEAGWRSERARRRSPKGHFRWKWARTCRRSCTEHEHSDGASASPTFDCSPC